MPTSAGGHPSVEAAFAPPDRSLPVLSTLALPDVPGEPTPDPSPAVSTASWSARHLRLLLTSAIGLLVGVGVTYLALRPEPVPSVFSGPPSVQQVDRPAPLSGDDGLRLRAPFQPSTPAAEPASARAALTSFLDAEVADRSGEAPERSAESFALLDPSIQERHGSVAAWRQTRAERVVPATFQIVSERRVDDGSELTVAAVRTPSITPFRGLVAAETTEIWLVAKSDDANGGWRVQDGRPRTTVPKLPADAGAVAAAGQWIDGAARCDRSILSLQVERTLLGAPQLSQTACEAKGSWSAGRPVPVAELDDITPFVAAYGSSVGRWARGVEVRSGEQRFTVILGPVGNEWRVMGLLEAGATR